MSTLKHIRFTYVATCGLFWQKFDVRSWMKLKLLYPNLGPNSCATFIVLSLTLFNFSSSHYQKLLSQKTDKEHNNKVQSSKSTKKKHSSWTVSELAMSFPYSYPVALVQIPLKYQKIWFFFLHEWIRYFFAHCQGCLDALEMILLHSIFDWYDILQKLFTQLHFYLFI